MTPTLVDGQFVLYEPGAPFEVGDVVVCRHPSQPLEIVKRVAAIDAVGLLELASDNVSAGTDSRTFGRVDIDRVIGRATVSLERPFSRL